MITKVVNVYAYIEILYLFEFRTRINEIFVSPPNDITYMKSWKDGLNTSSIAFLCIQAMYKEMPLSLIHI